MLHGQGLPLSGGRHKGQGGEKRHQFAVVLPVHRRRRWVPQLTAHPPLYWGAQQARALLYLDAQRLLQDKAVTRRFASEKVQKAAFLTG